MSSGTLELILASTVIGFGIFIVFGLAAMFLVNKIPEITTLFEFISKVVFSFFILKLAYVYIDFDGLYNQSLSLASIIWLISLAGAFWVPCKVARLKE